MTGVVAAGADGLVQYKGCSAGAEQIARYGSQLNEAGYVVIADLVDGVELGEIARLAGGLDCDRAGTRRLIELPWCRELAMRLLRDERLSEVLSAEVIPVQCTLFVKSIESNWLVSLHQDLSIPVAERIDGPGCQGWSKRKVNCLSNRQSPCWTACCAAPPSRRLQRAKRCPSCCTGISSIGTFDDRRGDSGKGRARRGLRRSPARWSDAKLDDISNAA